MGTYDIRYINSKLLYLTSFLIEEYEDWLKIKSENPHRKNFFYFPPFEIPLDVDKKITERDLEFLLIDELCIKHGIIQEIYADIFPEDYPEEKNPIRSLHFFKNDSCFFLGLPMKEKEIAVFSIKMDLEKAQNFLNEYLFQWLNDELYLRNENLLKSEKQVATVVSKIFDLLKKHPSKNLILQEEEYWKDLDFIAVLFFLEKKKYISILNIDATSIHSNCVWKVRVNVENKFYQDFQITFGTPIFGFENIKQNFYKNFPQYNSNIQNTKPNEDNEDEDDCFTYDGGISMPYTGDDLELYILKKILIEHKSRSCFFAKELSFNNSKLENVCSVIERLIEDKILYLSANTRPESFNGNEGIENKKGFINWDLVKNLDENPSIMEEESGAVIFDVEVDDEVKLKGRLDISIEEFMSNKGYNELGYLVDLQAKEQKMAVAKTKDQKEAYNKYLFPKDTHPYIKQKEIVLNEIIKDQKDNLTVYFDSIADSKVDLLKVLLALEKENILRIKKIGGVEMYDKHTFVGQWSKKDHPYAEIQIIQSHFKHLKSQSNKVTNTDKGEKNGNIWFNNKTGAIWVSNVKVGELEPGSRGFHFFAILFEFYPMTVDYPTLTKKILERLKKKTQSKTPQNYCQTVKSDIKRYAHRTAELIKDFTTEKGERGYRLISPERQKKPRN